MSVVESDGPDEAQVQSYLPGGQEGAGFRSNTMSSGPKPTFVPSGILIHVTVWPQYTNVTYTQDRQTGQAVP